MDFVARPWQRVAAELLGTTLLIFAIASSVVIPVAYLNATPGVTTLVTASIQGMTLVVVVSMFSWVSGSHLNPAVTAVSMLTGKMEVAIGFAYMVAQMVGAILGAAIFRGAANRWRNGGLSSVGIGDGTTIGEAFLLEFMITTILLMVATATAVDTRQGVYILAPIPIGFAVLVGVLIARTLTGASMNPARAFGPALVDWNWDHHWLYWIAPLASVIFVAVAYRTLYFVKVPPKGEEVPVPTPAGGIAANPAKTVAGARLSAV